MDNALPGPPIFKRNETATFLIAIILCDLLVILISLDHSIEFLAGIVGLSILLIISRNLFIGICSLILLNFFIIRGSEEITTMEIIYGLCFFAVLGSWLFRRIFLSRERILLDWLDYSVAAFLILATLSIVPALLFGSSISKWARELIPILTLILLFVFVEYVNSSRRIRIVAGCFFLLSLCIAFENLFLYKMALSNVVQLWEIAASRQSVNAPLLMAAIATSIPFIVQSRSRFGRAIAIISASILGIALILTFSRGYWMATGLSVFVIFLVLPWAYKRRFMTYVFTGGVVSLLVSLFLFGDLARFVFSSLGSRFLTIGDTVRDLSLANRIVESEAVLDLILHNPIIGYGLGMFYSYKALIPADMPTSYVHNTLLFFWFKLGLFAVALIIIIIAGLIWRSYLCYRNETDSFIKMLYIGIMAYLMGTLLVSFTSLQLMDKDSALVIALMGGVVQSGWHRLRPKPSW